jgi:hypothetical protein
MTEETKLPKSDTPAPEVGYHALFVVAQIAAMCCNDLDGNLVDAHKRYMSGETSNGAFQHVLWRHTQLHAALRAAGFIEKHPIHGWPVLPTSSTNK